MACPDCGSVTRTGGRRDRGGSHGPGGPDGSWIARETLAGRISTLPRSRKALLPTGAVMLTGSPAAAVTLLASAVVAAAQLKVSCR
ncbi:hypothetical protein ACFVRD_09635 [Streptomyces sp. NPDC057908]|uniref:hypothetical protein n=1 Tax=Streptomyces sp. NPDC057908 TaxID=3346276 RepID=UPI0036F12EDC